MPILLISSENVFSSFSSVWKVKSEWNVFFHVCMCRRWMWSGNSIETRRKRNERNCFGSDGFLLKNLAVKCTKWLLFRIHIFPCLKVNISWHDRRREFYSRRKKICAFHGIYTRKKKKFLIRLPNSKWKQFLCWSARLKKTSKDWRITQETWN